MDEYQKYYAELKEPNTESVLYYYIYMKLYNRQNYSTVMEIC